MKIRLVIFDMDGVLVDACEWHKISLNMVLKEVYNFEISDKEHYEKYNGLPTRVKLNMLADEGKIQNNNLERIEKLKQIYTIEAIKKNAILREEKIELINFLKLNNIKVACYTNSIRMTAELMLEKTGILNSIDLLITNQEVKKPKPDPEGYNLILNILKISNNETIIIEDSPKGIKAAESSKCKVIVVNNVDDVNIKLLQDLI
jgi:HAD superfamily hydrolase (TIGR01509 family)